MGQQRSDVQPASSWFLLLHPAPCKPATPQVRRPEAGRLPALFQSDERAIAPQSRRMWDPWLPSWRRGPDPLPLWGPHLQPRTTTASLEVCRPLGVSGSHHKNLRPDRCRQRPESRCHELKTVQKVLGSRPLQVLQWNRGLNRTFMMGENLGSDPLVLSGFIGVQGRFRGCNCRACVRKPGYVCDPTC